MAPLVRLSSNYLIKLLVYILLSKHFSLTALIIGTYSLIVIVITASLRHGMAGSSYRKCSGLLPSRYDHGYDFVPCYVMRSINSYCYYDLGVLGKVSTF